MQRQIHTPILIPTSSIRTSCAVTITPRNLHPTTPPQNCHPKRSLGSAVSCPCSSLPFQLSTFNLRLSTSSAQSHIRRRILRRPPARNVFLKQPPKKNGEDGKHRDLVDDSGNRSFRSGSPRVWWDAHYVAHYIERSAENISRRQKIPRLPSCFFFSRHARLPLIASPPLYNPNANLLSLSTHASNEEPDASPARSAASAVRAFSNPRPRAGAGPDLPPDRSRRERRRHRLRKISQSDLRRSGRPRPTRRTRSRRCT